MKQLTGVERGSARARVRGLGIAALVAATVVGCAGTQEEGFAPEVASVADSAVTAARGPRSNAVTIVGLTLSPVSATLQAGASVTFRPLGWLPNDNTPITASVTWTATGGTITSGGTYTAGPTPGTFQVLAKSTTTGHYEPAVITITAAPSTPVVTAIAVSPSSLSIAPGAKQKFTATATLSSGTQQADPPVSWTASGGSIGDDGTYTAPLTAGTYQVIGSASGKADTSVVQVGSTQKIVGLTLTPTSATLAPGAKVTFTPDGWLPGADTPITASVTWTATGGTITSAGVYTAGTVPGTYRVLASSTTTGHTEPAVITIKGTAPSPTVTSVVLTPATVTLAPGATQQLAVSAKLSDGTTQANTAVTWTATGGTITSAGRYSAGQATGTFRVIAKAASGPADTSAVTIQAAAAPAATLTSLSLTPAAFSLASSASQQLSRGRPLERWRKDAPGGELLGHRGLGFKHRAVHCGRERRHVPCDGLRWWEGGYQRGHHHGAAGHAPASHRWQRS